MDNLSLREEDRRHLWHPFTQHGTDTPPIPIVKGKGTCLYDESGKKYLDLISSWWTNLHGHSHPILNQALLEQANTLEHVMFAGFTHPKAVELSKTLINTLPHFNRGFFSDNGSTAVEVALKLAYQYWFNKGEKSRQTFLAFEGGYHGDTFGAMSVGRKSGFFHPYHDLCFNVLFAPYPSISLEDPYQKGKEEEALKALYNILNAHHKTIAALIIEPLLQGASGMRVSSPDFIKKVVTLAKSYGILVIYDEIAVGFYRTGTLFAQDQIEPKPDFTCLSKGLTGGYMPMALTLTTEEIYNGFLSHSFEKAFTHGHSYTANPLGCALAVASFKLLREASTKKAIQNIEASYKGLITSLKKYSCVENIRVQGTILAFDIKTSNPSYHSPFREHLREFYLKKGLNIRPLGNTVYLMPPYCIKKEELETAYEGILESLSCTSKMLED